MNAQIRKVILQNHMVLDCLTTSQGSTCTFLQIECYTYVPDHQTQVQEALQEMDAGVSSIQRLQQDLLTL